MQIQRTICDRMFGFGDKVRYPHLKAFDQYCRITWKCEIGCMSVLFTNMKWYMQYCVAISTTAELLLYQQ